MLIEFKKWVYIICFVDYGFLILCKNDFKLEEMILDF